MDVADENTEFSSFNYWRVMPLDLSLGTTTPGELSTEDNSMADVQSTDESSDASKGGVVTTESPAAGESTTCQSSADQQGPSKASSCTENSSETRGEESSSAVDPQSILPKCTCSQQSCNSEDSIGGTSLLLSGLFYKFYIPPNSIFYSIPYSTKFHI